MTSTCATIKDLLPAHVGGALDGAMSRNVEAHLATCAECTAEAAIITLLRSNPVSLPEGLQSRVTIALHSRRRTPRPSFVVPTLLAASLAGALLMVQQKSRAPAESAQPTVAFTATQTYEAGLLPQVADPILAHTDLFGGTEVVPTNISDEELKRIVAEVEL